jgi:hypothetical protein
MAGTSPAMRGPFLDLSPDNAENHAFLLGSSHPDSRNESGAPKKAACRIHRFGRAYLWGEGRFFPAIH